MTTPPTITEGSRRHQGTEDEDDAPVARLLPAAEADATEIAYYRDRLEDPTLLDAAAAVLVNGFGYLAVPVGGRRRGGFLPTGSVVTGLAVRAALAGHPGFPDVRLRWSADLEVCHSVEWGERPPQWDDQERGRFYGYRAEAIARYLAWLPDTALTNLATGRVTPRAPARREARQEPRRSAIALREQPRLSVSPAVERQAGRA